MDEPAVYYSPRAWVRETYTPADWRYAERCPPPEARPQRLYLRGDGTLGADGPGGPGASIVMIRIDQSRPRVDATC
jgi:predicted acyl esterase